MGKRKRNRRISGLLAILMAAVLLTGCGRQPAQGGADGSGQNGPAQNGPAQGSPAQGSSAQGGSGQEGQPVSGGAPQKGKYVETGLTLPEGMAAEEIAQIFAADDKLHFLVKKDGGDGAALQEWEYDGESFQEVTQDWLKQITLGAGVYKLKLLKGQDGAAFLYAAYAEEGEESYKGHLFKSVDGSASEEITPEKWTVEDPSYGFYSYPNDIGITDGGLLIAKYYSEIDRISSEDGSIAGTQPFEGMYSDMITTAGDQYYLVAVNDMNQASSVEAYGTDSAEPVQEIPFSQKGSGYVFLDVLKDGTLMMAGADGVFRCSDGSNWEKLVEGIDTSLSRTDIWGQEFVAFEDGTFYVRYGGENGYAVMKYVFDPNAEVIPTTTLNVYAVRDNSMLQQAAVLFHRKHPEIIVEVESALGQYEDLRTGADYNQIFQNLNTKLMAGEGADVLVMDNMDQNSFIEKGLLLDINDIVSPLEKDNTLLGNVTGSYLTEGGNRYVVPLQFSLTLCIGREVDVQKMKDVASLAQTLGAMDESLMGPQTPQELVEKFLPYFLDDIIEGSQLNKEALKTNLEYLKAIGESSGMVMSRAEHERAWNIWDIASRAKLALHVTEGFNQAMLPISAANLVKGDYAAFGGAFFPKLEVGVYAKTEQPDMAKEFVAFLLSEEIQNQDYYSGFPVNAKSLESLAAKDRSDYAAVTTIEMGEGGEEMFEMGAYPPEDAAKLMDACRSVSVKAHTDDKVLTEIAAALPGYLDGSRTVEQTIEAIDGALAMYLAE